MSVENTYLSNNPEAELKSFMAGIDIHVHFREPGFTHKETMATGINAANAGGIYTVVDMPNTKPVTDTKQAIVEKKQIASEYEGIHLAAGLTNKAIQSSQVESLATHTPIFKVFLANSTGDLGISPNNLVQGLGNLNDLDKPVLLMIHAEDPERISERTPNCDENTKRPPEAEIKAVKYLLPLADEYTNINFHITHVSTYEVANILANQSTVTWDVLAKHLEFSASAVDQMGNYARMNPPLRDDQNVEGMRAMLAEGQIPIVASDHAPHTKNEKSQDRIVAGAPGVQETYPFLIDLYLNGVIDKSIVSDTIYANPREVLRSVGIEVDPQTIWVDINGKTEFTKATIQSKCEWSLWEGRQLRGRIIELRAD